MNRGTYPVFILWGPPGVGKTTLAGIIASTLRRAILFVLACDCIPECQGCQGAVSIKAGSQQFFDQPNPILFIDEIHGFNKSQQDSLLGAVETGDHYTCRSNEPRKSFI
ncbi:MAG: AAA family ATPase [Marinilabiliales bacterium]|nr:AAA family ATPase [Marinilabiliales bacterium]